MYGVLYTDLKYGDKGGDNTPPRGGSRRSEPAEDGVLAVQSTHRRFGGPDRQNVYLLPTASRKTRGNASEDPQKFCWVVRRRSRGFASVYPGNLRDCP